MRKEDIETVLFWQLFNTDKEVRKHFAKEVFRSICLDCFLCGDVPFEKLDINNLDKKGLEIIKSTALLYLDFCVQNALDDLTHSEHITWELLANYLNEKSRFDFFQEEINKRLGLLN